MPGTPKDQRDIGRADIARADLANVAEAEGSRHHEGERDGAQEIATDEDEEIDEEVRHAR